MSDNPFKAQTDRRQINRLGVRVRNLERRVIPPTASGPNWAYMDGSANTSCPGTGTTTLTASSAAHHFYTDNPSMFSAGTNGIIIAEAGHYYVVCTAGPTSPLLAGSLYEIQNSGGGDIAGFFAGKPVARIPASSLADEGLVTVENLMTVTSAEIPTSPLVSQIVNSASNTISILNLGILIVQLDTDETELF